MAAYCNIHPKVIVNGEVQDSTLYSDIYSYTFNSYEASKNIYFSVNKDIQESNDKIPRNAQNEPTLEYILDNYSLTQFLPKDFESKLLNNFGIEETGYTVESYHDILERCEELNNSVYGNVYYATVKIEEGKIVPVLNYKNTKDAYSKERDQQKKSVELYNKILPILDKWGIKIDALTDAEERLSVNGVVDFESIERATDGFYHIIRLAKGITGEEALPEELGHVIYRAMEANTLMQRVFNLIKNKGLQQDILGDNYDRYVQEYQGDEDLLTEEAIGKLIAVHFLNQIGIDNSQIYSKILGRTINSIDNFFSKLDETELSNAVYEVNNTVGMIVRSTIAGNESVNPMKMRLGGILKQIDDNQKHTEHLKKIVENIIRNEHKRKKIYKNSDEIFRKTANFMDALGQLYSSEDYTGAILMFLESANADVKAELEKLNQVNLEAMDISSRSAYLRNTRNVIFSYLNIIKEVKKDLQSEFKLRDDDFKDKVNALVNESVINLGDCLSFYNDNAMNLMRTFWTDVLGEDLKAVRGVWKPREIHYTVDQLLTMDVEDISIFDRYMDSMAHSSSYILKGMDKIVKDHTNKARLRTLEFNKKISLLTKELERAGYKNQNWMFEKDANGHRTGNYISSDSEEYKRLSDAQKKYYDAVMQMKAELESLNPPSKQNVLRTIKIRKDLLERIKTSTDPKTALHAFTESIKEGFLRNSTETEYGTKSFMSDFEGFEYQELPVFYTYLGKETSEDDISMDIVSTMTAYAANVYKNDELGSVIDTLELTRAQLRTEKNPLETQAGKLIKETTGAFKRQDFNNIVSRLNDFFDMQIYGKKKADEGTIGGTKIDKSKVVDRWIDWNSSINTAFNILMNISNVATGNVQFKMEAVGGQFFKYKDALAADKIFGSRAKDFIADLGNRTKSSWFYVVSEAFDVMQDYDNEIGHKEFDKKWYERLSLNGLSMVAQNAGEIWMQHRTFFALMHSDKEMLVDKDGKKIRAINAFDVVPLDKSNPRSGAELVFKEGLKTQDGKTIVTKQELKKRATKYNETHEVKVPFTSDKLLNDNEISETQYIRQMSRKSAALNQYMHGIYNEADKAAMYRKGLGRLVGQYRKWIKPSLNRRFKSTSYNYDLDSYVEGTYITAFRFIAQNVRDIRAKQFDYVARFKSLNDYERANLRKVNAELAVLAIIAIAIAMLPDDDDKIREETYLAKMYRYQLYRLRTEIGTLTPSHLMVSEGLKILKSPAAGISTLERVANCATLFTPWNWKEIQSGRYKGWYRPWNSVMDLVPYHRAIWRTLHPEEGVKYYL